MLVIVRNFGTTDLSDVLIVTIFNQVASALLISAFLYDIFWVFISPLIFKKSVMITVKNLSPDCQIPVKIQQ